VPERQEHTASGTSRAYQGTSDFETAIVAWACEAIRNAPNGEQETTLHKKCFMIGGLIESGSVDEAPAEAALIEAAYSMPSHDPRRPWKRDALVRHVRASIDKGKQYPLASPEEAYDDSDWRERAAKFEATNPFGDAEASGDDGPVDEEGADDQPDGDADHDQPGVDDDQPDDEPDGEAEAELKKYVDKLREARDQTHRNALAYNAGKRLARFIKAGRLDAERVLIEIDAVIKSWGENS
jgi:hypothetical protein